MTYLLYIVVLTIMALNTFFGLGPVLLADGSFQERMITLSVVILIYIFSIFVLVKIKRRKNKVK